MERTSTYPYKACWNPLSLSMEGEEMIWIVCWCLYSMHLFKPSLLSRPTSQKGGELAGFSSDNIEGWILSHFTLAQCDRTNSFAAYALAFTGKSNIKRLNVHMTKFESICLQKRQSNTLGACCLWMHPVGCLKNLCCLNICFTFMMSPCIWAV